MNYYTKVTTGKDNDFLQVLVVNNQQSRFYKFLISINDVATNLFQDFGANSSSTTGTKERNAS